MFGLEWVEAPGVSEVSGMVGALPEAPEVLGVSGLDGWVVLGRSDGVLAGLLPGVGVFDGVGALSRDVDEGFGVPG